jgi:3-oxoacyl-[acyl-carrier-protein] synthase II
MNAAAGHISLHFKIKGPTSTITVGGASAISALFYAYCLIRRGVTDTMLVVASDECNEPTLAGFGRIPNFLSRDMLRPFDRRGAGTLLGGASTAFLVQSEEAALNTGAKIYAELGGFGMTADTQRIARINEDGTEWARSFELAMADAGITSADLGAVIASANGLPLVDRAEAHALQQAVGAHVPITAPKAIFGEALSAASGLNILAAIAALREHTIPVTANLEQPLEDVALDFVYGEPRQTDAEHVLVSSYAVTGSGNYHTLVLKRY